MGIAFYEAILKVTLMDLRVGLVGNQLSLDLGQIHKDIGHAGTCGSLVPNEFSYFSLIGVS